jgi:tRNA(fMet)-specific endonuclease VapC
MMGFLIDTNICSAHLKNARNVSGRFLQYAGSLSISAVTLGELASWALRSKTRKHLAVLDDFLNYVDVLDVDRKVGWKYGELNRHLLDRGLPPPAMDLLIAATAIVHNLTLVTHNARDFVNIPGLTMIDWLVP